MNTSIKFGTDGWRAIIGKDYTVENVARVTEATAKWLLKNYEHPSVVVGHDCRFAGELFADTAARVLTGYNIKVYLAKGIVSTPMISLGTVKKQASLGIIITASHNPPSYNGFKLKGSFGGPLIPKHIAEIEEMIPDVCKIDYNTVNLSNHIDSKKLEYADLETMYCEHAERNFDIEAIRKSGITFAYDAMFGAGQNVMKRLFPDVIKLHCERNPQFNDIPPEPIHKNLQEFSALIKNSGKIACGLVTDGDADRIGLYDSNGNFVDSHHIVLLLLKYLVEVKHMKGKVINSFSLTPRVKKMCEHYGLEYQVVKIGFKYIAEIMIAEDVLLGGEESGGIAIKGHIPERDGIWMGLVIWEYMAKTGKSLRQLIDDVYKITDSFAFERNDLLLDENLKNKIVTNCTNNLYKSFGDYSIQRTETIDGWKYFFNEHEWLMIRASGTEPVLRTYAESFTKEKALDILEKTKKQLLAS